MTSSALQQSPYSISLADIGNGFEIHDRPSSLAFTQFCCELMSALINVIQKESELVRKGKLLTVAELEPSKALLVRDYMKMIELVTDYKAMLSRYAPDELDTLRKRHATFRAELQINMAALATAKAVSQSIVENVAKTVEAKRRPMVYGQHGAIANPKTSGGIALDKAL
jgi:hypothetical protein